MNLETCYRHLSPIWIHKLGIYPPCYCSIQRSGHSHSAWMGKITPYPKHRQKEEVMDSEKNISDEVK